MTHEELHRMNDLVMERPSAPPAQTIADLVAHVRLSHHVTTRVLLCRIEVALVGAAEGGCEALAEAMRIRHEFAQLRGELVSHMAAEERSVFPYVRALDAADRRLGHAPVEAFGTASPLRLAVERAGVEDLFLMQITALQASCRLDTAHDWEPAISALRELHADLVEHIRFEHEELFPRAAEAELRVLSRSSCS